MFEQKLMESFYAKARAPEDLVWHRDDPPPHLVEAVAERSRPGRALDLGCGAGIFSTYLAEKGYDVVGLDFIPKALEMAKRRAEERKVRVRWVEADLFDWTTERTFDLVLDSGCLHNFGTAKLAAYKNKLLSWLAPDGDYVLAGFGKRHAFDWRPIGPRRRTRDRIVRLFAPELEEVAYHQELMEGIPLPIGPSVLGQSFRFRRTRPQ